MSMYQTMYDSKMTYDDQVFYYEVNSMKKAYEDCHLDDYLIEEHTRSLSKIADLNAFQDAIAEKNKQIERMQLEMASLKEVYVLRALKVNENVLRFFDHSIVDKYRKEGFKNIVYNVQEVRRFFLDDANPEISKFNCIDISDRFDTSYVCYTDLRLNMILFWFSNGNKIFVIGIPSCKNFTAELAEHDADKMNVGQRMKTYGMFNLFEFDPSKSNDFGLQFKTVLQSYSFIDIRRAITKNYGATPAEEIKLAA